MKYVCLGYFDERRWESLAESERNALMDRCFAYDDELRRGGHVAGGEALQSARLADGPFAETREQIGGILFLEARDLNEAIQLVSRHPGVRIGPFEIRAVGDLDEAMRASALRRGET
jgi:hypothetical protein